MEQGIMGLFGGGKAASEARARRLKARNLQDSNSRLDARVAELDRTVNALEAEMEVADRAVKAELRKHGKPTPRARRLNAQRKNLVTKHELTSKMLIECEQQRSYLSTLGLTQDYTDHMREIRDMQQSVLGDPDELDDMTDTIEEFQDDQEEVAATMQDHTDTMARVLGGGGGLAAHDDELAAELEEMQLEELHANFDDLPLAPRRRASPSPTRAPPSPAPAYNALLDAM